MAFTLTNPIQSVQGVSFSNLPPCEYKWSMQDVSAPDAGRTEDGVMDKARIGQVVALDLAWNNIDTATAHTILAAFQPEYLSVTYLDPLFGVSSSNYLVTKTFYVGDRSAPLYNCSLNVWQNITFRIIEKTCVNP